MIEFVYSLQDLPFIVRELNRFIGTQGIVTLRGPMGAGKTTLIRALLQERGIKDEVTSPTFSYMHSYKSADQKYFLHFDLYRLDSVDQFIAAGFDEYMHSVGSLVLIEWPEIIESLLATIPHYEIVLDYKDNHRKLMVKKYE